MKVLAAAFFLLGLCGCATYSIPTDEYLRYLKENQSPRAEAQILPLVNPAAVIVMVSTYPSNGLGGIPCVASNGEKVYLHADKNTVVEFTSKSTNDVVKMYFDTIFLVEGKLIGLRSRLIQSMTRQLAVDDIEKIEITAEFPKTRKIEK
jgi:hypothetical protein